MPSFTTDEEFGALVERYVLIRGQGQVQTSP